MENGKTEFSRNGRTEIVAAFLAVTFIVSTVVALSACGSSAGGDNGTSNTANRSKTSSNITAVNAPDVNQPTLGVNGQNVEVESQTNRMRRRIEELRANAANQKSSKVPKSSRPAPEDSIITTELTDVAREIRIWKKDPALLRVEKSYSGDSTKVKIVLRDGRVFEMDGKNVANLDQITSAAVLQLVNVIPPKVDSTKSGVRPEDSSVKKPEN